MGADVVRQLRGGSLVMTAALATTPHGGTFVANVGPFNVTIVRKGDHYGRENCLTHGEDEPMVEFYDAGLVKPGFTTAGQFIARYYLSTLRKHSGGLSMLTYVPQWTLTAEQFDAARVAVEKFLNPGPF